MAWCGLRFLPSHVTLKHASAGSPSAAWAGLWGHGPTSAQRAAGDRAQAMEAGMACAGCGAGPAGAG